MKKTEILTLENERKMVKVGERTRVRRTFLPLVFEIKSFGARAALVDTSLYSLSEPFSVPPLIFAPRLLTIFRKIFPEPVQSD